MLDKLDERVLDLPAGVREDHHDEVPDERLSGVEVIGSVIVDDGGVVKFAKPAKIHGNLIVEPHELGGLVEVLQVFVVVEHFDEALHQLAISVHGVLVEAVVKVVREFFVLRFAVGGIGEVVLVEGVLEDVLGFHDVNRPSSHLYM